VQHRSARDGGLSRGRPEPRNREGTSEEGSVEGPSGKAFGFAGHVQQQHVVLIVWRTWYCTCYGATLPGAE
jgi:hypothetical protein